ncbi:MAG TPA: sugar nucleotide-binding protein, partial [Caulobacteraceae bacterium]
LVFDGLANRPYQEGDRTAPLNVYGRSKAEAERRILELGCQALIVRTASFFSAHDPHNFAAALVGTQRQGRVFTAAEDVRMSPTHTPELADAVLDLLIDGATGVWHLANEGEVSWAEFARLISRRLGTDAGLIRGVSAEEMGWAARRPARSSLTSTRGAHMADLDKAIDRYARELQAAEA